MSFLGNILTFLVTSCPASNVKIKESNPDHERICLDPKARNVRHTCVTPPEDEKTWHVQQTLVDPEGDNNWLAKFEVDLTASRKLSEPFRRRWRLGALAG
jgi:hypothetical protein